MTDEYVFVLATLDALRAHEQVVPKKVRALEAELRRTGIFVDPIWVARGTDVILNGHHRVAALRILGAQRIPAWLLDYDSDLIRVDRWKPGPPISKAEVVRRAKEGKLFSPQTTRHRLAVELPRRPTPLAELLPPGPPRRSRAQAPRSPAARRSRAGSSRSG
jgi:L-serine kinase (ADP)